MTSYILVVIFGTMNGGITNFVIPQNFITKQDCVEYYKTNIELEIPTGSAYLCLPKDTE